jgi:putative ABC transport system permease protein
MRSNLRYALRGLARNPGFALAAILTLALGIGAVTSIFSVADAMLIRRLPYPEQARLVMVWDQLKNLGVDRLGLYGDIFHEYAAQTQIFEATAAFEPRTVNLAGERDSERVAAIAATASLLPMLGATPSIGRGFENDEHRDVALLGHSLFMRRYAGDPGVIGRSVRLDGRAYTVIGVLRPDFDFGGSAEHIDIFTPLVIDYGQRLGTLRMLARLRTGVSFEVAHSAMEAEAKHLDETLRPHYGPNGENPGFRAKLVPLREEMLGDFRTATLILLLAVSAVMLIVCANIANLLLARAVAREKEIVVRRALGASRVHLLRQWMTESAVLVAVGGTLGSIAAVWGVRLLITLSPAALPSSANLRVDARALIFTVALSMLMCVVFGLAPTIAATGMNWTMRGSRSRRGVAPALIAAEVAFSLVLLVSAGLLLKSFLRLQHVDPGFNPEHVLTMRIDLTPQRYPDAHRRTEFFETVRGQIESLPGVVAVGAVSRLPIVLGMHVAPGEGNPFSIEGQRWHPGSLADGSVPQMAHNQIVDTGYFHALQIPLLAGRNFTESDRDASQPVVIVNEKLARGFFPQGAIGHRILLGAPLPGANWMTIVGVVGDVKTAALGYDAMPQFYTPESQDGSRSMAIVVRTRSDPGAIARQATALVYSIDPEQPVYGIATMQDRVSLSIGQPRFETVIVSFFAVSALFLAAIGIFGVVAHSTAQRTREIGIRIALGADSGRVVRHVMLTGLRPVLAGALIGITGALAAGKILSTALFHVKATDPATFAIAVCALGLAAAGACLGPARKAARIDPAAALGSE